MLAPKRFQRVRRKRNPPGEFGREFGEKLVLWTIAAVVSVEDDSPDVIQIAAVAQMARFVDQQRSELSGKRASDRSGYCRDRRARREWSWEIRMPVAFVAQTN
jgi:hypothetical protein